MVSNVQEIHVLYQAYCDTIAERGRIPQGYEEFLEQLFIASSDENDSLVDEVLKYQEAAEVTHAHYQKLCRKSERLEILVETVEALIETGEVALALQYLKAEGLDDKALYNRLNKVIVELNKKILACEDSAELAVLEHRQAGLIDWRDFAFK